MRRGCSLGLVIAFLAGGVGIGAGPASSPLSESERALTEKVDAHLARAWAEAGVEPTQAADDAEFLRRVWLDVAGKIPTAAEARAFLDDPTPDKRARLVDNLLRSNAATNHAVNTWRNLLIPEAASNTVARVLAPDFDVWLRARLIGGVGLDVLARDLFSTPLDGRGPFTSQPSSAKSEATPLAYYAAKGYRPEDLAASTARQFLGVRIECAQCHNHPFSTWKRDEFWSLAAAFAGLQQPAQPNGGISLNAREDRSKRELEIPGTSRKVSARFPDGTEPATSKDASARQALAKWMTSPDNPYFAKAAVNRIWSQLFGIGLVDPVDDFGDANPPSHPELLEDLAAWFISSGYDRQALIRALTATRAYGLSSDVEHARPADPRLFARGPVRGLTSEQFYDSLAQAVGMPPELTANPRAVVPNGPRAALLEKFAMGDDRPTEHQTSIPQALALMNGAFVAGATDLVQGETLGAVADAPFLDDRGRVETLFLAALSRRPRPEESARLVAYVASHGSRLALADVFWALLNSAEFKLNH
ncbi:DUF1553 domain-containing protein [Paludisphaera rhizosphaerae]|uniref:DUF1553 domain-containing protein n=1 Tax=Paludisphaera rhizosphaerae TaxID=2711216 RepID=UPI0013EC9DDB|nr:DUF1553 domain-containing protein [Paludisphaera rhizosphaerae]